jgi:hypothetical protein
LNIGGYSRLGKAALMKVGWRSSALGHDGLAIVRHRRGFVDLLVELDRRALVARGDAAVDPGVARGVEPRAHRGERFAVEDTGDADQHGEGSSGTGR